MQRIFAVISILLSIFCYTNAFAQKKQSVIATSRYYASEAQSLQQAKILALQLAQAHAIDSIFGTHVSSYSSNIINNGGNVFTQISETEVRGIWLKDNAEPKYDITYEEHGFWVACTVNGVVRGLSSSAVPCQSKIYCNGWADNHIRSDFKNGDNLYMTFASPVKGYLTIYLLETNKHEVECLLPYYNQTEGIYPIEANKMYYLFSYEKPNTQVESPYIEGYTMFTDVAIETDMIYVVFSPNKFYKAPDRDGKNMEPRALSFDNFNKWLSALRRSDDEVTVTKHIIDIKQ